MALSSGSAGGFAGGGGAVRSVPFTQRARPPGAYTTRFPSSWSCSVDPGQPPVPDDHSAVAFGAVGAYTTALPSPCICTHAPGCPPVLEDHVACRPGAYNTRFPSPCITNSCCRFGDSID